MTSMIMLHRHILSLTICLLAPLAVNESVLEKAAFVPSESDVAFLRDLTKDVVAASHVPAGKAIGDSPTNSCGFTLIMPGGNGGYPAFWIRDFSMSLESGFITPEETLNHLRLIVRAQNGRLPRSLKNGLLIPAFAIPDHVNFDGKPVFYPGTYASGEDQGDGRYGICPPMDDNYEFIHIAHHLFRVTGKTGFLLETAGGLDLIDRLEAAFNVPNIDVTTGLNTTDAAHRAVGFGFCDGIYFTGKLLFPSLLQYRAAGELSELFQALHEPTRADRYRSYQKGLMQHLTETFAEPKRIHGWLMAATETGRQPDVWGTLYALHLGVLDAATTSNAVQTIVDAITNKTILFEAAVRHVPIDMDFSTNSAWERTAGVPLNTYQNGAYWHTATGWLIEAANRANPKLASEIFGQYIRHLRENDYRSGQGHGAPWECLHGMDYRRNAVYMTSVTVPYSVLAVSVKFPASK